MKIRKDSWHARLYAWWQKKIPSSSVYSLHRTMRYNFNLERYERVEPRATSLCHYFWVVVLRAPIRGLFQGEIITTKYRIPVPAIFLPVVAVATLILGLAYATTGTLQVLGVLLGVVAGVALIIGGLWVWDEWVEDWWIARNTAKHQKGDGLAHLIGERVKAKKKKVCPIIEFTEETVDNPAEV